MSASKLAVFVLATAGAAATGACGNTLDLDDYTVAEPVANATQTIINGIPPDAPHHRAVVALHQRSGYRVYAGAFCSGTLVTPTVVVTAAHCLDTASGGTNFRTMSPSSLAIYVGDNVSSDPSRLFVAASETLIHKGYSRLALLNDIALVRLGTEVPAGDADPVPPLPAAAEFTQADVGTLGLNFAGFGVDENNNSDVKLQLDGTLGGLGCSVAGCSVSGDAATQISYRQAEGGPCFGDSGGPAFVVRAQTMYLGGVTSWGDSRCIQYGVSTRVDAFEGWIAEFAGRTTPSVCEADGTCNPECAFGTDPDCTTTNVCGDDICGDGESCDGRSGTVACSQDCAGRTKGKPTLRYCYVEGICAGPGCP